MRERKRGRARPGTAALSARLENIYLRLLEREPEETTEADMAHMEQLCRQMCELEEQSRSGRGSE